MGMSPERATALALGVLGAFQLGLAAGARWGRAAYGGAHPGRLPTRLRAVSGAATAAYAVAAVAVDRGVGSDPARRRALTTLSALMGLGAVANAASRSPIERALWTPLTLVAAATSWRARPRRSCDPRP